MTKVTKLTTMVRRLLLAGHSAENIAYAAEGQGLLDDDDNAQIFTRKQVLEAVAAVRTQMEQAAEETPEQMLGWVLETSRAMFLKLNQVGDYAGALRAAEQVRKVAETKERLEI